MVMYDFQERKLANRILYSWPVLFLAGALVAVSLFGVFRNIEKYVKMKREVALAEEKLSEYEASRKRFEERLSALNTEEGLEKEARARFNLKKPGEKVIIFLDSDLPKKSSSLRSQIASAWESVKKYIYEIF